MAGEVEPSWPPCPNTGSDCTLRLTSPLNSLQVRLIRSCAPLWSPSHPFEAGLVISLAASVLAALRPPFCGCRKFPYSSGMQASGLLTTGPSCPWRGVTFLVDQAQIFPASPEVEVDSQYSWAGWCEMRAEVGVLPYISILLIS